MRGVVNARREAVVRLRMRGPTGVECYVDAIVDSGFTASLTLPATLVNTLRLVKQSGSGVVLADGSVCQVDTFAAEVEWDGTWLVVLVSAVGNESLLGMRLLAGHRLVVDVVAGGLVEIIPLP